MKTKQNKIKQKGTKQSARWLVFEERWKNEKKKNTKMPLWLVSKKEVESVFRKENGVVAEAEESSEGRVTSDEVVGIGTTSVGCKSVVTEDRKVRSLLAAIENWQKQTGNGKGVVCSTGPRP